MSVVRSALLSLCVAPLLAQGPELRSDVQSAWRSLQATSPSDPWHVQWSRASGTPRALFGPGLRVADGVVNGDDARRLIDAFLRDQAALLGVGNSDLQPRVLSKVGTTWISVHAQRYRGLEVIDGRADVRLKSNGTVAMFGGVLFAVPDDFDVTPAITEQLAVAIACNERQARPGAGEQAARNELVIWADADAAQLVEPRLAWRVPVRAVEGGREQGEVFVDARSGAVLDYRRTSFSLDRGAVRLARRSHAAPAGLAPERAARDDGMIANVSGTLMAYVTDDIGPNGTPHNVPLAGVMVQVVGGGSAWTDAAGGFDIAHTGTAAVTVQVSLNGAEYVGSVQTASGATVQLSQSVTPGAPVALQLTTATSSVADLQQATAYYLADKSARFVRQAHLFAGDPAVDALDSIAVRVMDGNIDCNAQYTGTSIEFGTGSGCGGAPMAFSTVVEHEWGHGLDDAFGGIAMSNDGLEEGYADVLANLMTGQPLIGRDFPTVGQVLRDANNTATYPNGSFPHEQGLTWMGGCWKAREAFAAASGAAGVQHAETILLGAIAADPGNQPEALLEVYVLDDDDGVLNNSTPNCAVLSDAFTTQHGIPSPLPSCSTNPGVVVRYGTGCPGSGLLPSACEQSNGSGGALAGAAPSQFVFAYAVDCTAQRVISAIELFTRSAGGASATVSLHADVSGVPAATPLQSTSIAVGAAAAFYQAVLPTPEVVAAGQRVWILHDCSAIEPALLTQGSTPSTPTLVDFGVGAGWWAMSPDAPSWRIVCAGSGQAGAVPSLEADSVPTIGQTMQLQLSAAAPSSFGLFAFGLSDTQHLGVPLPFSLAGFGAPGCDVLAAPEAAFAVVFDAAGNGALSWTLPNQPSAVDLHVFVQAFVADPTVNSLGIVASNGVDLEIGIP